MSDEKHHEESKIMAWLKDPSPAGLLVFLTFLAIIAAAAVGACERDETTEDMIRRLDHAPWITERENGEGWEAKFAESFERHAAAYDVPAELLVVIAERESRFVASRVGDHGRSFGLGQVGRYGRRKCECDDSAGYDEEIRCSACWLRAGVDWCGDLKSGLTSYVCGRCETSRNRTKMLVLLRLDRAGISTKKDE